VVLRTESPALLYAGALLKHMYMYSDQTLLFVDAQRLQAQKDLI
jgi:hypothetical protein